MRSYLARRARISSTVLLSMVPMSVAMGMWLTTSNTVLCSTYIRKQQNLRTLMSWTSIECGKRQTRLEGLFLVSHA